MYRRPWKAGYGTRKTHASTSAPAWWTIPPRVKRTSPPTMTVWARALTSQPPKGVLRLLERNFAGSMVHRVSGSMMVITARDNWKCVWEDMTEYVFIVPNSTIIRLHYTIY